MARTRPTLRPAAVEIPRCAFGDVPARPGPDGDWVLAMIDTELRLPEDYVPPDLVRTARAGIRGGGLVREIIVPDLRALVRDARDGGRHSSPCSRPIAAPRSRPACSPTGWPRMVSRRHDGGVLAPATRSTSSARPSTCAPRTGRPPWTIRFDRTKAGRWIAEHAVEHGFVISYPKGAMDRTCYHFEPWHVRWVGREVAARIAASGLTPREWLYRIGNDPVGQTIGPDIGGGS